MRDEDLSGRQSPPQCNFTHVPQNHDWRNATAVSCRHDFPNTLKEKSTTDKKSGSSRKSVWASLTKYIARYQKDDHDEQPIYEIVSLKVRLRFTGTNITEMQRVLGATEGGPALSGTRMSATPSTTRSLARLLTLESVKPAHNLTHLERPWVDETRPFSMKAIRTTLQDSSGRATNLDGKYNWYNHAVPIHAIFPPGVPLSAKEINAYYPHHVRWKGVMMRLARNDYRGGDMLGMQAFFRGPPTHAIAFSQMNTYQRDAVKADLPTFKTISYKGKPDRNLYTDTLTQGKSLDDLCNTISLPTFDDLLRGLQHLPVGLDARGLTQCLAWYLSVRDSFTPPLELNVLHTRDLIHALRQPLRPFGPQNLDMNALKEWRNNGTFHMEKVRFAPKKEKSGSAHSKEGKRKTRLHINLDDNSVKLDVNMRLRHILTFPFLALHSVVGEALEMGIRKGETRKMAREEESRTRLSPTQRKQDGHTALELETPATQTQHAEQNPVEANQPYRIPKRPRPESQEETEDTLLPHPKKPTLATTPLPRIPSLPHVPTGPRANSRPPPSFSRQYISAPSSLSRSAYRMGSGGRYGSQSWGARREDGHGYGYGYQGHGRGRGRGGYDRLGRYHAEDFEERN